MTEQSFRPVLRTQADVERFWTTLCHPLGWRTRELWIVLVDADGEPFPSLHRVCDVPREPDDRALAGLVGGCGALLAELDPGGRVALLLCRPGPARVTGADRAWAVALAGAAREAGVVLEVVHLASDDAIVPLPLDAVG